MDNGFLVLQLLLLLLVGGVLILTLIAIVFKNPRQNDDASPRHRWSTDVPYEWRCLACHTHFRAQAAGVPPYGPSGPASPCPVCGQVYTSTGPQWSYEQEQNIFNQWWMDEVDDDLPNSPMFDGV